MRDWKQVGTVGLLALGLGAYGCKIQVQGGVGRTGGGNHNGRPTAGKGRTGARGGGGGESGAVRGSKEQGKGDCCDKLRHLQDELDAAEWSSNIFFVDPKDKADVGMRIYVVPRGTPCISKPKSKQAVSVPIPPTAEEGPCGSGDDKEVWYSNRSGVGALVISPGKGKGRSEFLLGHSHLGGEDQMLSYTLVLPENYEWRSWKLKKAVDESDKPVKVHWKKWTDRVLTVSAEHVHEISAVIRFGVKETALAKQLKKMYSSCPDCVRSTAEGVRLRLPMSVLFASGKAEIAPRGRKLLDRFLATLKKHIQAGGTIVVEGHTDSVPIHTSQYPSNWELSTARASAVVRYFLSKGLPDKAFVAVGRAGTAPVASNKTEEGRRKNRRVVLFFKTAGSAALGAGVSS